MPRNPLVKPYLKWAGGKRQLLTEIRQRIPREFQHYYEPFIGAGAVFFDLQPRNATINDFNEQLIITYRAIMNNVDELIDHLRVHVQNNNQEYYYTIRELDRDTQFFSNFSNVEKAARLIYLNKTCYNGLYRVNSQGLFNVPYGNYSNPSIFEESILRAISRYFNDEHNNINIFSGDYYNSLQNADQHSFVYFDPPYHSPNNTNFTGYQAGGFNEEEQIRLRDVFQELTERGCRCLLSNSNTEFIRNLYQDYNIEIVQATRAINADGAGRGRVNEVLIRNW